MRIGFIGLGIMGRPMALNLLKAGHRLQVWARRADTLAPLIVAGATEAPSPAAVAHHADLVITMVADASDVIEVLFSEQGVARGAHAGLTVIDMSTIAPEAARDIALRLADHGIDFLDARNHRQEPLPH